VGPVPDTVPLGIPAVEVAQRSDPGRDPDKQVNEDAAGTRETVFGHLCVVCDGMGGHEGGREASTLALQTIFEVFESAAARRDGTFAAQPRRGQHQDAPGVLGGRELLRDAVALANRRVYALAGPGVVGRPGSTVVALLLHAAGTEVAHVGDSRVYRVHQGQISQVTRDHSMVQQLVDAKILTPEQAATHPEANKITRALGMSPEVEVEVLPRPVAHVAGDVFVLCTDGLSDLVGQPDIVKIAATSPAAQAAGQLVDLANARGGHDNITVIVLRARETALTPKDAGASAEAPRSPITETMPSVTVVAEPLGSSPASVPNPPSGAGPAVPARVPPAPSYHATDPPIGQARRGRRVPASVVLAAVLGLVGLGVGGVALWLVLPHHKNTPAVPLDLTPSRSTPSSAAPRPADSAEEPPAAPLPSLVPSPPLTPPRHLRRVPSTPPEYRR